MTLVAQLDLEKLDITTPAFKADPHPVYRVLRDAHPVAHVNLPGKRTAWLVSRYADAVALLRDERFYSRPGVWNFLLVLGTEKEKLLEEHYRLLAQAITDNYPSYGNQDLCLAICDFIARNYEAKWASELLKCLKSLEAMKPAELRGPADEGLKILEREVARSLKSRHST